MIEEKLIEENAKLALESLDDDYSFLKYKESDKESVVYYYELDRNKVTVPPMKSIINELKQSKDWLLITEDAHAILIEDKIRKSSLIDNINKLSEFYIEAHISDLKDSIEDLLEEYGDSEYVDAYLDELSPADLEAHPFIDTEAIARPLVIIKRKFNEPLFDLEFILELYESDII